MSRIGKKIVTIPTRVTVDIKNSEFKVKGPKGELVQKIHPHITITQTPEGLVVKTAHETDKKDRALWGTFASLLENMVEGVTNGFKKQLEINGVGYKASLKGANLSLEVGFSHPVEITPPSGAIKFTVEKNIITVEGIDKQLVGEIAAQIRQVRKPEPYKGKGIRYEKEVVRRKQGKKSAT
jgi:large subunit ribosomal protein L6